MSAPTKKKDLLLELGLYDKRTMLARVIGIKKMGRASHLSEVIKVESRTEMLGSALLLKFRPMGAFEVFTL
jgi:hypothetical protein